MAYFTKVDFNRALTADETTSKDNYIAAQVAAGTTDGNVYQWNVTVTTTDAAPEDLPAPLPVQYFRLWSTLDSANGYIALANSFSPPATNAKIY